MDNNLGLMERFANPELFEGLTFAEKMAGGAVTLLMSALFSGRAKRRLTYG